MVKIANYLDFNLQAYQERLGLVNFLDEQGLLSKCPPSELDKVANYLLYAEDVDAEVELKEGSRKKVSYEALIESALGEATVQRSQEVSIYRVRYLTRGPFVKYFNEFEVLNTSFFVA